VIRLIAVSAVAASLTLAQAPFGAAATGSSASNALPIFST
jgi:hypothetical protein